jgi:predicted MFS family arabinose efflux permease
VSYIAVILALFAIHTTVPREKVTDSGSPLQSIRDGVVYTWQHPIIRTIVLFASVMSVFGWSFMSMLPVVAKQTYGLGSEGMGYLFSALGLGSLSGTVLVSINSGRVRNSSMVVGGSVTFSLGLIAFSFAQDERLGMIFLFIAGMGILSAFATMTATVQYLVDDRYRGRVMSIYLMVLVGLLPIGNLEVGILSELFGTAVAIRVGSAVVLAAALLLSYSLKEVARAWQAYSEPSES